MLITEVGNNILMLLKHFNYSLFANAYMLVGAYLQLILQVLHLMKQLQKLQLGEKITLTLTTVPFNATDTIHISHLLAVGKANS